MGFLVVVAAAVSHVRVTRFRWAQTTHSREQKRHSRALDGLGTSKSSSHSEHVSVTGSAGTPRGISRPSLDSASGTNTSSSVLERHRGTAEAARTLVLECHPDAEETRKWNQPTHVVDGENRFYLAHYAEHVNLGFHEGASVDDPEGLLSGTGKAMRHVKLTSPEDLDDPALRALVERAA